MALNRDDGDLNMRVGIGRWLILPGPKDPRTIRSIFGAPRKRLPVFLGAILEVLFETDGQLHENTPTHH